MPAKTLTGRRATRGERYPTGVCWRWSAKLPRGLRRRPKTKPPPPFSAAEKSRTLLPQPTAFLSRQPRATAVPDIPGGAPQMQHRRRNRRRSKSRKMEVHRRQQPNRFLNPHRPQSQTRSHQPGPAHRQSIRATASANPRMWRARPRALLPASMTNAHAATAMTHKPPSTRKPNPAFRPGGSHNATTASPAPTG